MTVMNLYFTLAFPHGQKAPNTNKPVRGLPNADNKLAAIWLRVPLTLAVINATAIISPPKNTTE
jgi:hypothetical protein